MFLFPSYYFCIENKSLVRFGFPFKLNPSGEVVTFINNSSPQGFAHDQSQLHHSIHKHCTVISPRADFKEAHFIKTTLQGFVNMSMSIMASGQKLLAPPQVEPLLLDVMS